jgi:Uma2 family endonuclease
MMMASRTFQLMAQRQQTPIDYPYYEATVTESTPHLKSIFYLYGVLSHRYSQRPDVFVGANNFLYWEEGNTEEKQAPDVYVCFGASNRDRRSYKTWEEGGVVPQVVFEITSRSSKTADLATKKGVYEMLGVEEYYAYDPLKEYIPRGLRAFRLHKGCYREIIPPKSGLFRVYSPRLDLDLEGPGAKETGLLRLFEPGSQTAFRTYDESVLTAAREKERADEAEARAAEAEERLAKANARLDEANARAVEANARAARLARGLADGGLAEE